MSLRRLVPATLTRAVTQASVALMLIAQAGCAGLTVAAHPDRQARSSEQERLLDMDMAYLNKLNALFKKELVTAEERERLWQAYLARIQGTIVLARRASSGFLDPDDWPYPFIAPVF